MDKSDMVIRKYTFKLYPNKTQTTQLNEHLELHRQLYNAALAERIDCYRKTGKSISLFEQNKSIKIIRAECPEYMRIGSDTLAQTLQRLDEAYKAFFRRVKKGAGAGFPKFKGKKFFDSFSVRDSYKGWKFARSGDNWRMTIFGIDGSLKARGALPVDIPMDKSMWRGGVVMREGGKWYFSATVYMPKRRVCGSGVAGMDWGLQHFATIVAEG